MTTDEAGALDPFSPEGVTWTPVRPRLAAARLTSAGILLAIPALAVAVVALLTGAAWVWAFLVLPVGVFALLVPVVRRQVANTAYAEREDDLLVRRGVLLRQLVVVPYGRMQYVDVTAGPLARRFGIASVQLHTASVSTAASIDGLHPAEAARLRDRLASRGEAQLAGL